MLRQLSATQHPHHVACLLSCHLSSTATTLLSTPPPPPPLLLLLLKLQLSSISGSSSSDDGSEDEGDARRRGGMPSALQGSQALFQGGAGARFHDTWVLHSNQHVVCRPFTYNT